jgi:hypothetical protein
MTVLHKSHPFPGMHCEHSGQSCCHADERQIRAFWRHWQALMNAF